MLRKEDKTAIKSLNHHGVYQKDIALELGVHPRTISLSLRMDIYPNLYRQLLRVDRFHLHDEEILLRRLAAHCHAHRHDRPRVDLLRPPEQHLEDRFCHRNGNFRAALQSLGRNALHQRHSAHYL